MVMEQTAHTAAPVTLLELEALVNRIAEADKAGIVQESDRAKGELFVLLGRANPEVWDLFMRRRLPGVEDRLKIITQRKGFVP